MMPIIPTPFFLMPQPNASALRTHKNDLGPFLQQALGNKLADKKHGADGASSIHLDFSIPVGFLQVFSCKVTCCDDNNTNWGVFFIAGNNGLTGAGRANVDIGYPFYARTIFGVWFAGRAIDGVASRSVLFCY